MKSRKLLLVMAVMMLPMLVFADFSYQLDLLSLDPLHQEYTADRDRAGLDFQWLGIDNFPREVYQDGIEYEYGRPGQFPTTPNPDVTDGHELEPWMGLMHLGETLSMFRNTFTFDHWLSPIAFDFSFQGSLVLGLEGGMADMLGYDGVFFFGGTARIADKVSFRVGGHHYCTHYGDGTLKYLGLDRDRFDDPEYDSFRIYKKYIRMDSMAVALSVEPVDWFRAYGEYNFCIPGMMQFFDTTIFAPTWYDTSGRVQDKPDDYGARIINFGVEFSYPFFEKLGKTTLSYDCHAYEEGKIVYKTEEKKNYDIAPGCVAIYDPDRPWEFEHELVLSQEFGEQLSLEIGYHHGRFPLNSMYHVRCNYGYVGARVNWDSTLTVVDTAK